MRKGRISTGAGRWAGRMNDWDRPRRVRVFRDRGGVADSQLAGRGSHWQKWISLVPATRAESSVAEKARHSAWQAVVKSLPTQEPGMRCPPAAQPGQEPRWLWYQMGHSKG